MAPLFRSIHAIVFSALLAVLGSVAGCSDSDGLHYDENHALEQAMDQAHQEQGLPGMVATVTRPNGSAWTGTRGKSEMTTEAGNTPLVQTGDSLDSRTRFRIGSVTKSFTALLTLILAEEGYFNLDDRLSQWFPNFGPKSDEISLRLLLNMRSGLPDYEEEITQLMIKEPYRQWHPIEILELVKDKPFAFEPNEGWTYCNTGYIVLGIIAEQATGRPLPELIRTKILEPLKMNDTFMPEANEIIEPFARGYQYFDNTYYQGWTDVTNWNPSGSGAAGNMISTLHDLTIWLAALQEGRLVTEEHHREMFDFVPTGLGVSYGYGIYDLGGSVGHNGFIFGYTTAMYRYEGYDFIVLTNGSPSLGVVSADSVFLRLKDAVFE